MNSAPTSDSPPLLGQKKHWHAGTLTYSTAALMVLFFWLLWGDFSLQLKERSVPQIMQVLLKKFEASNFVVQLLITAIPQILAVLFLPIISYKSDRYRSRWGRRIPFLLIPTPLAFIAMVGLAYSPVIGRSLVHAVGSTNQNAITVTSMGVFWTLFEVSSVICVQIFNGLINDVVPKELLGRFFGMFRVLSLGAGMLFNFFLMGKVKVHFVPIFWGFGILYGVSFSMMCLFVKEGEYADEPDRDLIEEEAATLSAEAPAIGPMVSTGATPSAGPAEVTGNLDPKFGGNFTNAAKSYLRECFGNSYYVGFFISYALATMAFTPINGFSLYFGYTLGVSDDRYGKLSTLQFLCSLCQAYPIGWLADKFHPMRVTMFSLGLHAFVCILAFKFVHSASMFAVAHVVCGTIAGFWLTATAPLMSAIFPKTKFMQLFSAMNAVSAIGVILIGLACGRFMDVKRDANGNSDYHYMYLWAFVLMVMALAVSIYVYRRFKSFGGPHGYVAPQ